MSSSSVVVFDLETTFPSRGKPTVLLEFGCIVVDRRGWYETSSYSTLIKPIGDPSKIIGKRSMDVNGITAAMVQNAPTFAQVAGRIHELLDGQIWVGHNLASFDSPHLQRAFDEIGHPRPTCAGVIDTLRLVRKRFKDRTDTGGHTLEALTIHFGLGNERHRSVSDCRHTLEVLKLVSLTLLMEAHSPELFPPPVQVLPQGDTADADRLLQNLALQDEDAKE